MAWKSEQRRKACAGKWVEQRDQAITLTKLARTTTKEHVRGRRLRGSQRARPGNWNHRWTERCSGNLAAPKSNLKPNSIMGLEIISSGERWFAPDQQMSKAQEQSRPQAPPQPQLPRGIQAPPTLRGKQILEWPLTNEDENENENELRVRIVFSNAKSATMENVHLRERALYSCGKRTRVRVPCC